MALETFSYITSLVQANPANTDPVSQGDDHLRGIKTVLQNSFPNVNAAVTATPAQLNSTATLAATYAPINSPAFTGVPTAPTAAANTNTTQLATTAFATNAVLNYGLGVNQTWQQVTRTINVDYVNNTGRPIMYVVNVNRNTVSTSNADVIINGVQVPICRGSNSDGGNYSCGSLIIPNGATYRLVNPGEGWSTYYSWELR